jgi:hypothetical protein
MKAITDTGVRGYLKWLKADQPNLYMMVAPVIAQTVPGAFSNHEQSMAQGTLMGFSQDGTGSSDSSDGSSASATGLDVANAANTGAVSSDITAAIQGIVNGYSQVTLQRAQLQALQTINNTQLARAAAGLPPLMTTSNSMGVPTISGVSGQTTVSSTTLLWVAAAVAVFLAMRGGHRGA